MIYDCLHIQSEIIHVVWAQLWKLRLEICAQHRNLRLENPCAIAKSEKKTCFDAGQIAFCHCGEVLQAQVPKLRTDLDLSLLYILILGTYSKFARKINLLALGVYCPTFQSAFRRSRPQLKLGEEIESWRLVDD